MRDSQAATPFAMILEHLCQVTGAEGAALVDDLGETVDYAGHLDPFDIKIAAAEWCLLFKHLSASSRPELRHTRELAVRARRASYVAVQLAEGYAMVVRAPKGSFGLSRRALTQAILGISREAGLASPLPHGHERWTEVSVRATADRRPQAVLLDGGWHDVDVLGVLTTAARRHGDVGYRVRLDHGAELTLVREPFDFWYADSDWLG